MLAHRDGEWYPPRCCARHPRGRRVRCVGSRSRIRHKDERERHASLSARRNLGKCRPRPDSRSPRHVVWMRSTPLTPSSYRVSTHTPERPAYACEALRRAADRGVRIASVCIGAFALAAAGRLDGRIATSTLAAGRRLPAAPPPDATQSGHLVRRRRPIPHQRRAFRSHRSVLVHGARRLRSPCRRRGCAQNGCRRPPHRRASAIRAASSAARRRPGRDTRVGDH